jgi:hypothetical protein
LCGARSASSRKEKRKEKRVIERKGTKGKKRTKVINKRK